ncbi:MAG: WbqC family protein [Prevotellaceae bacterium]|jgi:hypothetical protein|nr:WbqC family protein [Prevotellaceae bacterium]
MGEVSTPATVWLSTAYLAPIHYYAKLAAAEHVFVEQHDHYVKQSYRNRCLIAAPQGVQALTVPVVCPEADTLMRDVRISDHGNWRHLHWNALITAYNHTPFFEYYRDDFAPFYERKYRYLMDFNDELCRLVCSLMDLHPHVQRTDAYRADLPPAADFRERIHPKRSCSADDPAFVSRPYYQVFEAKHGFLPNLSIVDLLFNMGTESQLYLER